ncbi:MAG: YnbE family lipoprotein [Alkalimonas sp.]|nr:YnbE family lipoprotein [Alkalimonas sp.]
MHHKIVVPLALSGLFALTACTPTVQVAAPSEPITINLNVKIEHEILIRVDRELDQLFSDSSGLF